MTWETALPSGAGNPRQALEHVTPMLSMGLDGQDIRLAVFRAANPHIIIGAGDGYKWWQAQIVEPDGETVITRDHLSDLLDELESMKTGPG